MMMNNNIGSEIKGICEKTGAKAVSLYFGKGNIRTFYDTETEGGFTDLELDDMKMLYSILSIDERRMNGIRRLLIMYLDDVKDNKNNIRDRIHIESIAELDSIESINDVIGKIKKRKEDFTGRWEAEEIEERGNAIEDRIASKLDEIYSSLEKNPDGSVTVKEGDPEFEKAKTLFEPGFFEDNDITEMNLHYEEFYDDDDDDDDDDDGLGLEGELEPA